MNKKLRRSKTDRVIAGVCGGLGEYFNIDPVIIRIIWAILVFLPGGPGIIVYLVCALVIPSDNGIINENGNNYSSSNTSNTPLFIGLGLILVGGFMLARVIWPGFRFKFLRLGKYWPVLLIILGIYILINKGRKR